MHVLQQGVSLRVCWQHVPLIDDSPCHVTAAVSDVWAKESETCLSLP